MNFSRKTILVVGAALLAACGDKVTVTDYKPPVATPKVNSVEVSPATATLNVGQSITLTAAVNADAGLATTVTWSSSDATKASVSTAGVVTAVAATPGVAICAASTVDTGKKGCASIVVTAAPATIPATVSINSIQITGALGGATANPANIVGGIDVTLNVNPGNQTITKVELLVGGKVAGTQTFTAAQSAALRYAADEAVAAQTTFPQVVFTVNTAAFDPITGAPTWLNGTQTLQGKVYTSAGTATASVSQNLTFNNANTFAVTTTVGGTTATANNAAGYRFTKGDVMTSVIPVSYSGVALASANVWFGLAACDLSGTAQRAKALTAPAAGAYAWTATWANSGTTGATNDRNYEFNTACASLATGEQVSIQTAQDANGNPFTTAALPANFGAGFRMDNRAPAAPAVFINPNGRLAGWVNDAVSFSTIQAAGNLEGMITAAIVDAGVGGVTYAARAGSYAAATVDAAIASADITSPATLAASLTPTSYCLIVYSIDALGNRSSSPAAGSACAATVQSTTIGVDRAAPTIAFSGGLGSNARINTAAVGGEFQVTVSDTGAVGNSGMNSANSVMGTVTLRNATAAGAATCVIGAWAAPTCSPVSVNAAPVFPLVPTTTIAANALPGYFTYTAQARDAAGNLSGTVTRVVAHDDAATPPVVVFATPFLPGTLNANSFSVTNVVSDNLDIRDFQYTFTYGATMGGLPIETPQVAVNGYNANPFINASYNATYTGSMLRQIQEWTAAPWTVGAAVVASSVNVIVRDQGGSAGTTLATPIPAGTIIMTGATDYAAGANVGTNFLVSSPAAATNVSDGAAATPANPTSVTLNADVEGLISVYPSPFTRVDFYAQNAAATRWVKIGSATTPVTTDNGGIRRHRYTMSWTPGTAFGVGARIVRAVGVNAANDGLSTANNANITITNP
ncbi:MAG TPA: Ig-like domain-containing protein [Gemmatimonadaceae bacterium]|jgi:hypothetical protein